MGFSFLWYDLETFGRHPRWDRIAQFAAVRTDETFTVLGQPVVAYCRLTQDAVPHPDACLITGLTPQTVNERGVPEREFARLVHALMSEPATCAVGFNSLRFDDEFVRALFYRNFYDPYRREYENGNSRWDIIDLLRTCHDLRPDGFQWVSDDRGVPVFKLELLAEANGISHEAHEALSDVKATIELARLVKEKNPRLFRYYFGLRRKEEVRRLLNLQRMAPILHTSAMFSSPNGCTAVVIPLSVNPRNSNEIISCDLRSDPSDWLDASPEEIRRRVFTKQEELGDVPRIPLKGIHINRCPSLSPLQTLSPERAAELGLDMDRCLHHAQLIRERPDLLQRVRAAYDGPPRRDPEDIDLQVYSGPFFPDEDREEFAQIRAMSPEQLRENPPRLYDRRAPEMLWRYIARNFPDSLTPGERERWKSFCASRILTPEPDGALDFGTFMRDVQNRLQKVDTPARDKVVLKALQEYGASLEEAVLR